MKIKIIIIAMLCNPQKYKIQPIKFAKINPAAMAKKVISLFVCSENNLLSLFTISTITTMHNTPNIFSQISKNKEFVGIFIMGFVSREINGITI